VRAGGPPTDGAGGRSPQRPVPGTLLGGVQGLGDPGFDLGQLELPGDDVQVPRGMTVLRRVPLSHVLLLKRGRLDVVVPRSDGPPLVLGGVGAGSLVGDLWVATSGAAPVEVVSSAACALRQVPVRAFLEAVRRDPGRWPRWLRSVGIRHDAIERRLLMLATSDLPGQIAAVLLEVHQRLGGTAVPLSHSDLAALLGARRPSISRALAQLRRDGLVATGYGSIAIVDDRGLRRLLAAA
jgi:CRP-like cAMP-binding protein